MIQCFAAVGKLLINWLMLMRVIDYPSPINRGTGYCFRLISLFVCIFVYFFVSLSARLWQNGWTDLHEIFREGVAWRWDDPITFLVNSEKPHDAAMHNTGMGFVVLSHHSLLFVVLKDLKSDRCRTQMAAARAVLEKSTMMLLTTTKVHLHLIHVIFVQTHDCKLCKLFTYLLTYLLTYWNS